MSGGDEKSATETLRDQGEALRARVAELGPVVWSSECGWLRRYDDYFIACRVENGGNLWQHRRFESEDDARAWIVGGGALAKEGA